MVLRGRCHLLPNDFAMIFLSLSQVEHGVANPPFPKGWQCSAMERMTTQGFEEGKMDGGYRCRLVHVADREAGGLRETASLPSATFRWLGSNVVQPQQFIYMIF